MEQKFTRTPVMIGVSAFSALAFALRMLQLKVSFDEIGVKSGFLVTFFNLFAIAAVLVFGVYSYTLRGRKKFASLVTASVPVLGVSFAAAGLLLLGGILLLTSGKGWETVVLGLGAVISAASWGGSAWLRKSNQKAPLAAWILPSLYFVVMLVLQFRYWTRDPVISDYCFELFALICTMVATFHLGGYWFEKGCRRMAVFACMGGVFFSAVAAADMLTGAVQKDVFQSADALGGAYVAGLLGYLAVILWLGSNLWLLLRPGKRKTEETVEEAPEEEPAQEEEPEE